MKIFLDTANVDEIRKANDLGVISGVTTNPSLMAKEHGKDPRKIIKEILSIVDGPVFAQTVSLKADEIVKEAEELAKIHKNMVIKIPMTLEGLKAVKILSSEGIKTTVTLIFSSAQALLAANAGADYVAPYVARLDNIGCNGIEVIEEIVKIFSIHKIETKVIAASVKNSLQVTELARIGTHIATIPYNVIASMAEHQLTDSGLKKFLEDWEAISKA